jgi:hypothetical protein
MIVVAERERAASTSCSLRNMRFWQTIKRHLSTPRFTEAPWAFKIVCFVLAFYLVFGLIAAGAWLGFGRNAEAQVVEAALSLSEIVGIVLVPLLLIGLVAVPLHRWLSHQVAGLICAWDRDRPKT